MQHPTLTVAVERLRRATTRQDAQAARSELAAALELDLGYKKLARCWARRLFKVRLHLAEFDVRDAEAEAFLFLAETTQAQLPPFGVSLVLHRWGDAKRHLNRWLTHQYSAVHFGKEAGRRFERKVWRAFSMPLERDAEQEPESHADRPYVLPAPLSCDGCDGAEIDSRGRCQRCRLRRRG